MLDLSTMQALLEDDELDERKSYEASASASLLQELEVENLTPPTLSLRFIISKFSFRPYFHMHRSADGSSNISRLLRSTPSILYALFLALLPRYMQRNGLQPTKKEHVTSYLDALRGWAAFVVLNHHHNPYYATWLLEQPGFTIITAGRGMVDVFFVISGYVLSYRMLKLMRTQQAVGLLDALVSSVFRRYLRLFGSAAIASFVGMVLVVFGWKDQQFQKPTLIAQLWDWIKDFVNFNNFFADDIPGYWYSGVHSTKYLDPLWTIPVEFKGSMVLFLFCAASCKLSNRNRMLFCSLFILICYIWLKTYVALFLGGCLFADLSFTRHPERVSPLDVLPQNNGTMEPITQHLHSAKKVMFSVMCATSIILLGMPRKNLQETFWPWPMLDNWTPNSYRETGSEEHFWLSIGALMLVFSLDCYPTLQTPLKWNISRYMGDLSFGIYVMHILVIMTLWVNILNPMRLAYLGNALWTHVPNLLIIYAAVFWAAELFIRVDDKVVTSGKWLQARFFTW
jgi:peptidoglycan/LPS O-acetylase OafA/YrhL